MWGYRGIITPSRSGNPVVELLCPAEAGRGSGSCGCHRMKVARGLILGVECELGAGPETLSFGVECKFGTNLGVLSLGLNVSQPSSLLPT